MKPCRGSVRASRRGVRELRCATPGWGAGTAEPGGSECRRPCRWVSRGGNGAPTSRPDVRRAAYRQRRGRTLARRVDSRASGRAMPAVCSGDGVAPRHLPVPAVPFQGGLLRRPHRRLPRVEARASASRPVRKEPVRSGAAPVSQTRQRVARDALCPDIRHHER